MRPELKAMSAALILGWAALVPTRLAAETGSAGITHPVVFAPFNEAASPCSPPQGLKRNLEFVQENARDFLNGVNQGLIKAAKDRHLDYSRVVVENDADRATQEILAFRDAKGGALVATSSDPRAVANSIQHVIWSGAYVGTVVPPPATTLLNAPQFETGKVLTDVAVAYIKEKLGGKATVVLLTQDSLQYLSPRFEAMRQGLDELPGVTIVADIAPVPVTKEGGFATMNAVLLANPDVDVVLGADSVVLGALQALRAAGKARPDQFLGGIDGEPEAVAEIKKGDSPYKVSIALSSPVFGYALGYYGADWLEGKSIPQAMDILPTALSRENIQHYEDDRNDPGAVFADPARRATYLKMYGNTCYDARDNYVNFPWSSEAK